jgi:hypothetical protein
MDHQAQLGHVGEPVTRRLLVLGLAAWTGRWLATQVASRLATRLPRAPAPIDSPRAPGWMPRRLDSRAE